MSGELLPLPFEEESLQALNVTEVINCLDREKIVWNEVGVAEVLDRLRRRVARTGKRAVTEAMPAAIESAFGHGDFSGWSPVVNVDGFCGGTRPLCPRDAGDPCKMSQPLDRIRAGHGRYRRTILT